MGDNSLLVRINYISDENINKVKGLTMPKAHIVKKNGSAGGNKYMLCGGIINKRGGMIIYNARTNEEAKELAKNNMMTNHERRLYKEVKRDVVTIPNKLIL